MKCSLTKLFVVLGAVAMFMAPRMATGSACFAAHGEPTVPDCLSKDL